MGRRVYTGPRTPTRFPQPCGNLQVNFCKNPRCSNYRKPASIEHKKRGRKAKDAPKATDSYSVHWAGPNTLCMRCHACGEFPPVKSNLGIHEERERMLAYLREATSPVPEPSCPNEQCANHGVPLSSGTSHYYANGKTKAGTPRYVCRACKRSFSLEASRPPTTGQRRPLVNTSLFKHLFGRGTISHLVHLMDIASPTFYRKLDFIYRQCVAFAASRERRFLEGKPLKAENPKTGKLEEIQRLYISVDRQVYAVNWSRGMRRAEGQVGKPKGPLSRRVTLLNAIASCDEDRKYIFGMHVNYDPEPDCQEIQRQMDASGEEDLPHCFRRHARFWTEREHMDAVERNEALKRARKARMKRSRSEELTVEEESELRYEEAINREDIESADTTREADTRLPMRGMQVHDDYVIYGHFYFLRELLGWVPKIRFFFEQESGMRAGCLTAFADMVDEKRCDAFYVWFEKNLTDKARVQCVREGRARIAKTVETHQCSTSEAKLILLKEAIQNASRRARTFNDKFMAHPFPGKGEPWKEIAYLTDRGEFSPDGILDEDHRANLYNRATMHNLDSFFGQIRRDISPLTRPSTGARKAPKDGKWAIHHPYRPDTIIKWLEIFRVYHNFVLVSKVDKKTPAMRMGLARIPIDVATILRYRA